MAYSSKEDQAAANKRHYEKNKEKIKARSRAYNKKQKLVLRRHVLECKKAQDCIDCGGNFHWSVMEFDHVRGDKKFNIADVISHGYSLQTLKDEIAKCELVCANCHRLRHFLRNESLVA